MKTEKDYTFLRDYVIGTVVLNGLWALVGSLVLTVCKLMFSENELMQNQLFWIIGNAVICGILGYISYNDSLKINSRREEVSLAQPVLGVAAVGLVQGVLWAAFGFKSFISPLASAMVNAFFEAEEASTSVKITIFVLQYAIVAAVTVFFYIKAKREQDTKNEAVKKLRGEKSEI